MSKDFRMGFEKVLDILGEIFAFLALVLFVFTQLNTNFKWISNETFLTVVAYINTYAGFLLIAVVGLEGVIKRNIIIRIIFYLLLAVAVIFLFFPGTYDGIISQVNGMLNK